MRGRERKIQDDHGTADDDHTGRRFGARAFTLIDGTDAGATGAASGATTSAMPAGPSIPAPVACEHDEPDVQLQALVHALPQLVWASDATGQWRFTSEQWETFTGLPAASRLGEGWRDQVHPDDRAHAALGWLEALRHGIDFHARLRLQRFDGEWRRFDFHGVAVRGTSGHVVRWFGSATDVEGTLRTQEILRDGARRLQAVLENLSEGVIVADLTGKILQWNRAGQRMHGCQSDDETLGRFDRFERFEALFELTTLDGTPVARNDWPLHRVLRGETVRDWPLRLRRVDREWERVFSYGGSLIDAPEGASLALVTITDITERFHAHADLERQRRELERSNKELAQFAFVASHDLQEPLRAVASFSELLDRHYGERLDDRGQRYLRHIADGARRMQQMVRDLLDFAHLGKTANPLAPVSLDDVLSAVLADLAPAMAESQATVDVEKLPAVWGHTAQLHQLFLNLIGNALKFRREVLPRVAVTSTRDGGTVCVSVRDNGIGIAVEHRERVFRMFQRLHARSEYPGNGLGLATARKIVDRHGGEIWLESVKGEGTTFHCTLPAADRPLPEDLAPSTAPSPARSLGTQRSRR